MAQPTSPSECVRRSADHMLVLEKGLAVIECFDGHAGLSVSEVASVTGLSRAAARRCLMTLATLRYATFDGRVYRLAPRILRLGYSFLSGARLPQIIQPFLKRLSADIGESCSASVLDHTDVLYIARAATERIISVDLNVGSRLPSYCNAMGRVLLAALPETESDAILRESDLVKRTPATLTDMRALKAEIRRAAELDYCVVRGELEQGLLTIAVPVRADDGTVVAAINVSTHADRATPDELVRKVLPKLRALQGELRPLLRG